MFHLQKRRVSDLAARVSQEMFRGKLKPDQFYFVCGGNTLFLMLMLNLTVGNRPKYSVRIAGRLGVEPPHLADPQPLVKIRPRGRGGISTTPPKFCWSWYAAWFTLPSNAVLKISTEWWFECYYYLNSYWKLWLSSPGLFVKFLLSTWICNNLKKQIWFLPLPKYRTVKVKVVMIKF